MVDTLSSSNNYLVFYKKIKECSIIKRNQWFEFDFEPQ